MPFVFLIPTIYNLAIPSFSTLNPSNYYLVARLLKRNLKTPNQQIKTHAYQALVRPKLEYVEEGSLLKLVVC
jgi:hypothetical protein